MVPLAGGAGADRISHGGVGRKDDDGCSLRVTHERRSRNMPGTSVAGFQSLPPASTIIFSMWASTFIDGDVADPACVLGENATSRNADITEVEGGVLHAAAGHVLRGPADDVRVELCRLPWCRWSSVRTSRIFLLG